MSWYKCCSVFWCELAVGVQLLSRVWLFVTPWTAAKNILVWIGWHRCVSYSLCSKHHYKLWKGCRRQPRRILRGVGGRLAGSVSRTGKRAQGGEHLVFSQPIKVSHPGLAFTSPWLTEEHAGELVLFLRILLLKKRNKQLGWVSRELYWMPSRLHFVLSHFHSIFKWSHFRNGKHFSGQDLRTELSRGLWQEMGTDKKA